MGKQNNNFEYYKPQSDHNGLFVPSASESEDCKDSDSKTMFALPKRSFVRKKSFRRKESQLCKDICSAVIPFLIASFIIGTLVSIGYIILGVNGMQQEIELLKIQLFKVKSDEQSDLLRSRNIQNSVSKKLGLLSKDEKEIAELKSKVKALSLQVKMLNSTILQLKSQRGTSSVSSDVNKDLNLLKKGMADTGGEIKKLSDESEGTKKTMTLLSKMVKLLKADLLKVKEAVSDLDTSAIPTEPADTLEPIVPTTASIDHSKQNAKSLKKLSNLLKKLVDGYSELFNNKTKKLTLDISRLKTDIEKLNSTAKMNFITLHNSITMLQNSTKIQEAEIHSVGKQINSKLLKGAVNATSNGKILKIVKGMLTGLEDNKKTIANLTERLSNIEQQASDKGSQKREESASVIIENKKKGLSTPKYQTKPSEEPELPVETTAAFATSTASTKDIPGTTDQPTQMTSSIKTETTELPATTEPLTTRDMEPTKLDDISTPKPGKPHAIKTSPTKTESATTIGEPLASVRPVTPERQNSSSFENVVQPDKSGFNGTHQSTMVEDTENSTNVTKNTHFTAESSETTRKLQRTSVGSKQQMNTSAKIASMEGEESEFDEGADSMRSQGADFDGVPGMSDSYDDTFDEGFSKSEHFPKKGDRSGRRQSDFMSTRRSKHNSAGDDDGFDALDHLDDEVLK